MTFKEKVNFNSITDSFTGYSETLPKYELDALFKTFRITQKFRRHRLEFTDFNFITSAGPNHKISWISSYFECELLKEHIPFKELCSVIPGANRILDLLRSTDDLFHNIARTHPTALGRLSIKREGGGKNRIFAIPSW